jgi:hypothetical protein
VDEITSMWVTVTSTAVKQRLMEQIEALDARISRLEQMPTRIAGYNFTDTGITFKSKWETSTPEERRQLMLKAGITYSVSREPGTQMFTARFYRPDEMIDRLNEKKPLPIQG